jgi:hypothetical protein
MTDDGFKQTLQILADQGLKVRPKFMIIDATEFFRRPGERTMTWRDEHIVPLYNDAGIEKFALPPPPCPERSRKAGSRSRTVPRRSRPPGSRLRSGFTRG